MKTITTARTAFLSVLTGVFFVGMIVVIAIGLSNISVEVKTTTANAVDVPGFEPEIYEVGHYINDPKVVQALCLSQGVRDGWAEYIYQSKYWGSNMVSTHLVKCDSKELKKWIQ